MSSQRSSQRSTQKPPRSRQNSGSEQPCTREGYISKSRQDDAYESDEELGSYPSRGGAKARLAQEQGPVFSFSMLMSVLIILASVFGTYILAHQVRAKTLALALARDMNTALEVEVKESSVGAENLSVQLKTVEGDLIKARDKCVTDVRDIDKTLVEIQTNTSSTTILLKNEKEITLKLIKENELLEKKLLAMRE